MNPQQINPSLIRSSLRAPLAALAGALVASLFGCNSFDPKLGNAPFRCGSGEERCPEGYECVTYSPSQEVCELKNGGGGTDGGSDARRPFTCNDDLPIEPNDSVDDPTDTGIPNPQTSTSYAALAICPANDQDFFQFGVTNSGTDAVVEIEFDAANGTLLLDLLGENGQQISSGTPVGGNPNLLRVTTPNLPSGTYYAVVRSDGTFENNYRIEIITVP